MCEKQVIQHVPDHSGPDLSEITMCLFVSSNLHQHFYIISREYHIYKRNVNMILYSLRGELC